MSRSVASQYPAGAACPASVLWLPPGCEQPYDGEKKEATASCAGGQAYRSEGSVFHHSNIGEPTCVPTRRRWGTPGAQDSVRLHVSTHQTPLPLVGAPGSQFARTLGGSDPGRRSGCESGRGWPRPGRSLRPAATDASGRACSARDHRGWLRPNAQTGQSAVLVAWGQGVGVGIHRSIGTGSSYGGVAYFTVCIG